MARRRCSRGASGRSGYVLGFELRPGHMLQVAEADSLLAGQVQLIQAVALLRANDARDVVVCLIHAATGTVRERVAVTPHAPDETPSRPRIDC